jgi:hypothetical protein
VSSKARIVPAVIVVSATTGIATLIGFAAQASFGQFAIVFLIAMTLGPTAIGTFVASCIGGKTQSSNSNRVSLLRRVSAVCAAACACAILSFLIGLPVRNHALRESQAWCESQVSTVENYRRVHGRYPQRLEEAVDLGGAPRWVRSSKFEYRHDADSYVFDLWDGPLSGWCWNSTERRWIHYD